MHLKSTHVKGSNYLVWNRWVREKIKIYYNGEKTQKFRNLYTHIRKRHCTLKYSCDICQKEFTSLDTLRNHISIQHNEGTTATTCSFKCPHCDKEVQWARKLQMYIDQRHKCPKCEYVTQRTPDLRNIAEKWQKTKTKPESNWRHARKHFPWTEGDQIMQQFVLCDNFIMTNNCHSTNTKIVF